MDPITPKDALEAGVDEPIMQATDGPPLREAACPFCERKVLVYEDPPRCPFCACPIEEERVDPMPFNPS